ncbi:MAG: PAS domain S-box protein [Anaerolineales bacterium]
MNATPSIIRVLAIEDSPADARLIRERLAEAERTSWNLPHFKVEHVERLQRALVRLWEAEFDVVLSDLDLPDSRAGETVATLREHIPQMPLVVLTGREDEELARKSVRAGVQDYLYKDEATGSLLARTLMYAIERQQIHGELEERVAERTANLQAANEELEAMIAEHRQTEQALRESEARERARAKDLETLMDAVPAVIWMALDPTCRRITGNRASYRMLRMKTGLNTSMTPEEEQATIPTHFTLLHDGDQIPREKLPMQRACKEGIATRNYEAEIVFDDGTRHTIFGNTVPLLDDEGRVRGAISAHVDITERKRAEDALRRQTEDLQAISELSIRLSDLPSTVDHFRLIAEELTEITRALGVAVSAYDAQQQALVVQHVAARGKQIARFKELLGQEITGLSLPVSADSYAQIVEEVMRRGSDLHTITFGTVPRPVSTAARRLFRYTECIALAFTDGNDLLGSAIILLPQGERSPSDEVLETFTRVVTASLRQRRAEEAFQEAHRQLRAFFDHSPRLIGIFDREGRYQVINQALARTLGRPEEEILGKTFADLLPPQVAETFMHRVDRLAETQAPLVVKDQLQIAGEKRVFQSLLFPLSQDESGVQTFGSIASDVTEREAMEGQLRESREHLSLAIEGAELATWDWNLQTGEMIRSPRWAEMQGYGYDDLEPTLSFWEQRIHPEDAPVVREALDAHLEDRTSLYQAEYRLRTKVGAWKWILDTGKVLVRDEAGAPLRAVGIQQDITGHKEAEKQLARYAADLQRSNEELEQFAYLVSHDLQEPARIVASYLELLMRRYAGAFDEEVAAYIHQARESAERMQQMIRALLNLSRVGRREHDLAPTDVEAVLERTLRTLQRVQEETGGAVTRGPLPTVMADEAQLGQVFQNLIANALKFRRAGVPPRIHVSARREEETWVFAVADNGIGIDPRHAERIFEIFQRLHTWEEYPGTGIGLALARKIIARHGGRIWVESKPGEGATFYFTLPVASA